MEPIVYILQSSLPKSLKPLQLMKCRQLQESFKTKKLEFPRSGEIKIEIKEVNYENFVEAWQQLEEMLVAGQAEHCVEVGFEINFEQNPRFLTVRNLVMFGQAQVNFHQDI